MSTHDVDKELPPLPPMRIMTGEYRASDMYEYARAAIKADRQHRGEPVAWQLRLPDGRVKLEKEYPAWAEGGDGYSIKPLYAIPQPVTPTQEPAGYIDKHEMEGLTEFGLSARVYPHKGIEKIPAYAAPQPAEPVDKSANLQGNQVDKPAKTQGQTDEPQSGARVQDGDDQDWANTDPAIAFHLIDRYAKDWNDAGRMMQAYADAHIEADRQHTADLLKNPVHVHTNMCRGIIAPITFDQLAHVLGDEATLEWLASRQRWGEPVAWQWLDTAHFRKKIPSHSNAEEWRPLFTAPQPAAMEQT